MKYLTLTACLLFLLFLESCTHPYVLNSYVKCAALNIEHESILTGSAVGEAGQEPQQWRNFIFLKSVATTNDLLVLTDYKNPVVRCYAFYALAEQKHDSVYSILFRHLCDTSEVETLFGCIGSSEKVGDYFFETVYPMSKVQDTLLTSTQIHQIDSALLFGTNNKIYARSWLLTKTLPKMELYKRIKEIAINEHLPESILALARFKNKDDIPLIRQYLNNEESRYYALYGVREFPDTAFYPELLNIFEQNWKEKYYDYPEWRILMQSLVKYPIDKTLALFERILITDDKFRNETLSRYLTIAIKKFPNELFIPIFKRINNDKSDSLETNSEMDAEP
jgi:hypothetical protein